MNATAASKTYAKIDVESGVVAADPHKLISMLYQGALMAIARAKNGMMRITNSKRAKSGIKSKDIAEKCAAISQAAAIIDDGLNASLDKKVGGELAQNLSSLYDYMVIRLTQANLNNDMDALDEVVRLLNELKGAWEGIRQTGAASVDRQPKAVPAPAAVTEKNVAPGAAMPPKAANKVQMLYGRM